MLSVFVNSLTSRRFGMIATPSHFFWPIKWTSMLHNVIRDFLPRLFLNSVSVSEEAAGGSVASSVQE
jgi:hypothetical protein